MGDFFSPPIPLMVECVGCLVFRLEIYWKVHRAIKKQVEGFFLYFIPLLIFPTDFNEEYNEALLRLVGFVCFFCP